MAHGIGCTNCISNERVALEGSGTCGYLGSAADRSYQTPLSVSERAVWARTVGAHPVQLLGPTSDLEVLGLPRFLNFFTVREVPPILLTKMKVTVSSAAFSGCE